MFWLHWQSRKSKEGKLVKHFEHLTAETVAEAARSAEQGSAIIAGGTDLLGVLKDRILPSYPERVIDIKAIPELTGIEERSDSIRIGANTKLSDIAESEVVRQACPAFAEAAGSVASRLIRSQATLGGNMCQDVRCWYYRYPNQVGGRVDCARKDGTRCYAFTGENKFHSIFGGMRVHRTGCSQRCPGNVDIPDYLERIRANDIDGAAEILLRKNPLPAITSRVCSHFCMMECVRDQYDEEVNIAQVERFVGDYILEHKDKFMAPPAEENGKTVGIVGAGPAALSAAFYLRRSGYSVTIIDRMPEPGGLLMYALPEYRLPKDKVRQVTEAIADMGVRFRMNVKVGEDVELEEIISQYDSVFLDTGAWKPNIIGIDGEDLTQFGLEFLVEVKTWMRDKVGRDVVVVGGGNVAVDVAVTARRLGARNVTMVSLETAEQMPATAEELERAEVAQVKHIGGWGPIRVQRKNGQVEGLVFRKVTRLLDESGRFAPLYDDDDTMTVEADAIFLAVGQTVDLSYLDERMAIHTQKGRISVQEDQKTSRPGVFAGGDATTGTVTVIAAITTGRRASYSIDEYLSGTPVPDLSLEKRHVKRSATCLEHSEAVKPNHRPVNELTADLEDDLGLPFEAVKKEAERCLNCACYAVTPSDTETMLMALKAKVVTNMREYSADEFFTRYTKVQDMLEPGEIVTSVEIPKTKAAAAYDKFRERKTIDFAIVGLGSVYELEDGTIRDASIVLGAVSPVPVRASEAEAYLKGKKLTEEVAGQAAEIALAGAEPLAQNSYKIQIAKTLVKRSLLRLIESDTLIEK